MKFWEICRCRRHTVEARSKNYIFTEIFFLFFCCVLEWMLIERYNIALHLMILIFWQLENFFSLLFIRFLLLLLLIFFFFLFILIHIFYIFFLLFFKRRFGLGFLYSKWSIKWNIFYIKNDTKDLFRNEFICAIKKERKKVDGWPVFKAAMNHCSRRFNNLKMQFFLHILFI